MLRTAPCFVGVKVYGVRHGYIGLIENDIYELDYKSVSNIIQKGGTMLRTGRSDEFKDPEVLKKGIKNLTDRGINNLIVIGGDGSFRGMCDIERYTDVHCIGIPGTIDNDLAYTDYTIGFDTACNTVIDAIMKLRDTAASHGRIMVLEVMGRNYARNREAMRAFEIGNTFMANMIDAHQLPFESDNLSIGL